jgi:hypothetical protein
MDPLGAAAFCVSKPVKGAILLPKHRLSGEYRLSSSAPAARLGWQAPLALPGKILKETLNNAALPSDMAITAWF